MDYPKKYEEWKQERIELIVESFKGWRCGLVVALDTTLYNTEGFSDDIDSFLLINSYDNTPVIWSNPVAADNTSIQVQQLYVPYNDDALVALKVARRTLSLMCYMSKGIPIIEKHNAGSSYPGIPMAGDKYRAFNLNGYDLKLLFQAVDIASIEEQCWIALAYYRLASNSNNDYYEFLSYRQVVESSFNNKSKEVNAWIDSQASAPELQDWVKILPRGKKISSRMHETRALCAHVANTDNGRPSVITDPDDVDSVRQVQNDLGAIRLLAEARLQSYNALQRI